MKPKTAFQLLLPALLLQASLVALAAPTRQETERFLQKLRFVESDDGSAKALEKLDAFLAQGVTDGQARRALCERRINLLRKTERAGEALDLLEAEFARKPIDAETATRLYDSIAKVREREWSPTIYDHRLIRILELFLANPSLEKEKSTRAAFLLKLGDLLVERRYIDLALPRFREAASLSETDEGKAEALFRAAIASRELWDIRGSNAFLGEIASLKEVSVVTRRRAELLLGENAIFPVGHDWTPTAEALATAHRMIEAALAERSPLQQSEEAQNVLYTLVLAETKCGELKKAVQLGEKALDGKIPLPRKLQANIAILVAETHEQLGDKKRAIKYYELGLGGGDLSVKTIHLRIADLAIASKQLTRAVQAYSDAIDCCDTVQEKGLIRRLTKKITQLNERIHKNQKSPDSERFFIDTDDELSELTLDEE